jgi:hypothetical protein
MTITNGLHKIRAEAYDKSNNKGISATSDLNIENVIPDKIIPVVSITSPSS